MTTETDREWLSPFFALFNCHVNDAETKAKDAFIARYGKQLWNKWIQPSVDKGIMGIFDDGRNEWNKFFVEQVHAFVNEGIPEPKEEKDAS